MSRIALVGAAGAIGLSIAEALQAEGTPYRVIGRTEASLRRAFGGDPLAEIRTWNPEDTASISEALAGVETGDYRWRRWMRS